MNRPFSDTIEGRIFLLLDDKLTEIARALGKVDERGNVAEDLRGQILGQLSERLNYDRLYQDALSDPELRRTQLEVEAALQNAREAREVVFDLFQDLERFSLVDYQPFADVSAGLERLAGFLSAALADCHHVLQRLDAETYQLATTEGVVLRRFTTNRDLATQQDAVDLLGLDHPLVQEQFTRWRELPPEALGLAVQTTGDESAVVTWWLIEASAGSGERRRLIQPIALSLEGRRLPALERTGQQLFSEPPAQPVLTEQQRADLFTQAEQTLQRELQHQGLASGQGAYAAELVGYVEIVASIDENRKYRDSKT